MKNYTLWNSFDSTTKSVTGLDMVDAVCGWAQAAFGTIIPQSVGAAWNDSIRFATKKAKDRFWFHVAPYINEDGAAESCVTITIGSKRCECIYLTEVAA